MHLPNECNASLDLTPQSHLCLHVFSNHKISLRKSRTTSKALMSSHIRVGSISRSNNKLRICTHSRALKPPASQPSRLPAFAFEAPALLQQASAHQSSRSHQLAVSKTLWPETRIHTCTPASAKAKQQQQRRGSHHFLSSPYLLIIVLLYNSRYYVHAFELLDSAQTTRFESSTLYMELDSGFTNPRETRPRFSVDEVYS